VRVRTLVVAGVEVVAAVQRGSRVPLEARRVAALGPDRATD
jgi:hypothetical protein